MKRVLTHQVVEDQQWVRRYVAGQLSDVDAVAFEDFIVAHPDVAQQVELEQRMTAGIARVGTEAFPEAPHSQMPRWGWAMAACALLGLATMFSVKQGWVGGGPAILMAATPETQRSAARLRLAQLRGGSDATRVPGQSLVLLDIVGPFKSDATYSVTLRRQDARGNPQRVTEIRRVKPATATELAVLLNNDLIMPGEYSVVVTRDSGEDLELSFDFKKP
jgi:hypothetical protein